MSEDIVYRLRYEYAFGDRLEAADEIEKLRDMLLRSDKLTRQEWYDMRVAQLAEEDAAAALKETGDE